jgi:trehalose/maltose hydrolase-like predicted phosphorylase
MEAPLIGIPKPIASRFTWLPKIRVARNLLTYRYNQLDKAMMLKKNLGFEQLYPMVTMNGEGHNEWEITHEEIHRNGAIAFAIFNYHRFTTYYIPEKDWKFYWDCALLASKPTCPKTKSICYSWGYGTQ